MSFLAPWWLAVFAALGAAVVVLHLLARRRPRLLYFPPARFVPDRPSSAASLAAQPTDLPLMIFRLLLVLLLGLAFAQPVTRQPHGITTVVLLDRSRLAPPVDLGSVATLRAADLVLAFDSVARPVDPREAAGLPSSSGRGSLSAALVAALRATAKLAHQGDSLALTIISPFAAEEFDAATLAIRDQWKGRITLLPQRVQWDTRNPSPVVLPSDDPLSGTLPLLQPDGVFPARLVRGQPGRLDSAWAAEGGTLVVWPRAIAQMGWPRGPDDSIGGVAAGAHAVVAVFPRAFAPPAGATAAAWSDGTPAATVISLGTGCLKNVAIEIPVSGDIALRPSFLALTGRLLSPCAGEIDTTRLAPAILARLRGRAGLASSAAAAAAGESRQKTPANRWFLLGAALVFAAEPMVRRRRMSQ